MPTTRHARPRRLPRRFEDLVRLLAPQAIADDVQYENTLEMVDRLMAAGRLTKGQEVYLETLVQLIEAYETREHAIETDGLSGLEVVRHLLAEHGMNASDLARLLGLHPSMGSKLLAGERSLTLDHIRTLSAHFGVAPAALVG